MEERLCVTCDDDLLDDELHLVMQCESLKQLRTDLLVETYENTDADLFTDPISILAEFFSKECIKIFAKHILKMWTERHRLVYGW